MGADGRNSADPADRRDAMMLPAPPNTVPAAAWVEVATGRVHAGMPESLAGHAVVLLGEQHDQMDHHRWQLQTVAALHGRRSRLVLAFEMFPRRVQTVLDRWSAGALGEADFLAEVGWSQVWGLDAALYLPLFHFARLNRLPMLALNIDRATSRKVAAGGPAAVAPGEQEGVGEPAPARPAYRTRLAEVFKMHPRGSGTGAANPEPFERFVRAQLFWDRAMAEAIAGAVRAPGRPLVVGVLGRGHVAHGDGVPYQLAALGVDDVATALPWPTDEPYPAMIADLLFGIAAPG